MRTFVLRIALLCSACIGTTAIGLVGSSRTAAGQDAATASPRAGWTYQFSDEEEARLNEAGCRFEMVDQLLANRMALRGFSSAQFVQAYATMARLRTGKRGDVETIATMQVLGMDLAEVKTLKEYGGTLTDYYNSKIGGRVPKIAGWAMVGAGAAGALGGALVYAIGMQENARCEDPDPLSSSCLEGLGDFYEGYGIGAMIFGGIVAVAGFPVAIYGTAKTSTWLSPGFLENASVDELMTYRKPSASTLEPVGWDTEPPKAVFIVLPERGGATMGFAVEF